MKEFAKNKLLDSAVLIAVLTATAYFSTYLYEFSYMNYFGLGPETARVQLEQVLVAMFMVINFSAVVWMIFYKLFISRRKKSILGPASLILFILVFIQAPLVYVVYPQQFWKEYIRYSLVVLISFIFSAVLWLALHYAEIYKGSDKKIIKSEVSSAKIYDMFLVGIFTLLLIVTYSNFLGREAAKSRTIFKTTQVGGQTVVILREYDQYDIAATYSSKNNTISSPFFYLNTSRYSYLQYNIVTIRNPHLPKELKDRGIFVF